MNDLETERYKEHSLMLGQIAGHVEKYCESPEMTTLDAVKLIIAENYELKAEKLRWEVEQNYE